MPSTRPGQSIPRFPLTMTRVAGQAMTMVAGLGMIGLAG
jgi:hypothetical protein